MRISEGHKNAQLLSRLQSNLAAKGKASEQVSSGLRVQRASDDPQAHQVAEKLKAQGARFEAMLKTNDQLVSGLDHADRMLANATTVVDEALRIAQQFSSDTFSGEQMAAAAKSIEGLKESLLEVANSKFQGEHTFGGTSDQTPPYSATGILQGQTLSRVVEIAPREFVQTPVATDIFGDQNNVFAVLDKISAALSLQDTNAVRGNLEPLKGFRAGIVGARQEIGHKLEVLDHAQGFLDALKTEATIDAGKATDADPAKAISNLLSISNTLEVYAQSEDQVQQLMDQMLKL